VTFLISLISFVVVFSLMVFAHEFGHFIVAKKAGVRVREFGFGFPFGVDKPPSKRPLTWQVAKDKSGTAYTVNAIPFGGFVNLGENDPNDPTGLASFPKRVRLASLLAGPVMNVLLALVIFCIAALVGYPDFLYGVGVVEVYEGSPAQEAGVQANDVILSIGNLDLSGFPNDAEQTNKLVTTMVEMVANKSGQPLPMAIQRGLGADAQRIELTVTPRANTEGQGKIGVGIGPVVVRLKRVQASFLGSLRYGVEEVFYTLQLTVVMPIRVLQGLLPASAARTVGPMGIAALTGEAVQQSLQVDWAYPILHLIGVLNVAIAITNLLPLPALDGGRIVFILLEAIRGKPISPEKEGLVHGIGLLLLLALLVVITIQDIVVPLPQGFNWTDYLY
jgi:regulator of sigma E protease